MTIADPIYSAAAAILTQIAFMKEYLADLEETCEREDMTMDELFDQFDAMLDDQTDREFFNALRTFYMNRR